MSETFSDLPTLPPRAALRPRCPRCQARATVQRAVSSTRSGYEFWTLRCTKCGTVHEAQVPADPLKSDARGWLQSELAPPRQDP
jgi:transcription elongation factor Elf1